MRAQFPQPRSRQTPQATRPWGWLIVSLLMLASAGGIPRAAAAEQLDDRDRAVDWALGGLEHGSRLAQPAGSRAPAGSTPGVRDTGGTRASREAAGASVAARGTGSGATGSGGAGVVGSRGSGAGTSQPAGGTSAGETGTSSGGGSTGGSGSAGAGGGAGGETTEPNAPTQEPETGGGEAPGGIHADAGVSNGELTTNVQVDTEDASLSTGTQTDTGADTGAELGGQVDAVAEPDSAELTGSAELTAPEVIDASTATELDSSLSGGADDTSIDSDTEAEALGDDADDCALLGLIACPSLP